MNTLSWAYFGFVALFFVILIPSGKIIWGLYAATVIPVSWRAWPLMANLFRESRLIQWLAAYLGYLLISALWSSQFDGARFVARTAGALTMLHFVLITAALQITFGKRFERFLTGLAPWVGAMALMVITLWYQDHQFPESRMEGFGYLTHPIRSSAAFGIFALIAWRAMEISHQRFAKLVFTVVVAVIIAYLSISWTRTVLLALAAGFISYLAIRPRQAPLIAMGLILSMTGVLFFFLPELSEKLTRSMPYRPLIWADAWRHALDHPWFGSGYFAETSGTITLADGRHFHYGDSHSFFIANFRAGGIIGLGLALAILSYALYSAFRAGLMTGCWLHFALLVYGFVCVTPNEWELLTGTKEGWMFFWLPLGLAVSDEIYLRRHLQRQPLPNTVTREPTATRTGP